jgi:hypothetical protein
MKSAILFNLYPLSKLVQKLEAKMKFSLISVFTTLAIGANADVCSSGELAIGSKQPDGTNSMCKPLPLVKILMANAHPRRHGLFPRLFGTHETFHWRCAIYAMAERYLHYRLLHLLARKQPQIPAIH